MNHLELYGREFEAQLHSSRKTMANCILVSVKRINILDQVLSNAGVVLERDWCVEPGWKLVHPQREVRLLSAFLIQHVKEYVLFHLFSYIYPHIYVNHNQEKSPTRREPP